MSINKKVLRWSIMLSLLTAYILPSKSSGEFAFKYGYPFGFFTIHENALDSGGIILTSTSINLLNLGLNILILYLIVNFINQKILSKQA